MRKGRAIYGKRGNAELRQSDLRRMQEAVGLRTRHRRVTTAGTTISATREESKMDEFERVTRLALDKG